MSKLLELAETFALGEISNSEFTTARLWGIADTAPYLHDGRASTLAQAIQAYGGEAQVAQEAFVGLSDDERAELIAFLGRLRTPDNPNEELIDSPAASSPVSPVTREAPGSFVTGWLR